MIRSRLVLGKTVDDLDLDIAVSKNTFPIFGAGWDRLMGRQNETVKVTTFNRPKEMADQVFTLNVLDDKNYTLSSDGGFSARGQAGQMLKKEGVTLMVEAIHARPGSEFTVTKYSTLEMCIRDSNYSLQVDQLLRKHLQDEAKRRLNDWAERNKDSRNGKDVKKLLEKM